MKKLILLFLCFFIFGCTDKKELKPSIDVQMIYVDGKSNNIIVDSAIKK